MGCFVLEDLMPEDGVEIDVLAMLFSCVMVDDLAALLLPLLEDDT